MTVVRVYIVRHGETDENRLGIMQGQVDTKLNAAGIEQAQLAASALEVVPFKRAHSSDLERAAKTAEIILEKHPNVLLVRSVALRERHLGDWQGQKLVGRGSKAPANAEPLTQFTARATKWWRATILQYVSTLKASGHRSGPPSCVLVVSHGGYISRLLATLLESGHVRCEDGVQVSGKCWNASISVVEVDEKGQGILVSYSDTTHLETGFVKINADIFDPQDLKERN
ncbi:phosphoglycerate mutase-like protein [Laetiporus sulphureus 93-53]|uniref:Phosphoglycerate mutase-like protein n=1 Tax=Laetiporus sulphureus 93-53 TaxID=1314785 RepID=A0A165FZD3_9APHY|nr:phosphoglycerate mutase-like protein [Laetiporus sulphureus 93-53]KZT09615.1 phosphoglycerate mutase-like protein [Laetiporus sulphureus 93-53]